MAKLPHFLLVLLITARDVDAASQDAKRPVRKQTYSEKNEHSHLVRISPNVVDSVSKPGSSTADFNATSPVRKQASSERAATNDLIKTSPDLGDSVRKPASSVVREAKKILQISSDLIDSVPKHALSIVREAQTSGHVAADGSIEFSLEHTDTKTELASSVVREADESGKVVAADGSIEADDATSPVRKHAFSGKVVHSDLTKISSDIVEPVPKPTTSIVREANKSGKASADGSIEMSSEHNDSKTREASKLGRVASNDRIDTSHDLVDWIAKPSPSVVREAKKRKRTGNDADLLTSALGTSANVMEEVQHRDVARLGADSWQTREYEHVSLKSAKSSNLVKLGDTMLLQTGNKASHEAGSQSPGRVTSKKVAGLLATVATGGATPEVIEVLSTIIGELQTEALEKVKEDHNDTQAKINANLEDLETKTVDAVNQWAVAVEHDSAWLACVEEEKSLLQQLEQCRNEERNLSEDKWNKCNRSNALRVCTDTCPTPDLSLSCNFESGCSTRLSALKHNKTHWMQHLKNTVAQKKHLYLSAYQACQNATLLLEGGVEIGGLRESIDTSKTKTLDCNNKQMAFNYKKVTCEQKRGIRSIAMCVFGDKLHDKCQQKEVYDTTIGWINGTGTLYSDSERRGEWQAIGTVKCMLNQYKTTGQFTKAEQESCESSVDYDTEVGALNKKAEVYRRLIAEDNFTCNEHSITFNGSRWTVPDGQGNSSQYIYVKHNFTVNTSTSSKVFDFCREGDNGHNCSTFLACPEASSRRDNATVCQLAAGCTVADCCILVTPVPLTLSPPTPVPPTPAPPMLVPPTPAPPTPMPPVPLPPAQQLFAITDATKCAESLPYGRQTAWDQQSAYFCNDCGSIAHNAWMQVFMADGVTESFRLHWQFSSTKTLQDRFNDAAGSGEPVTWTVTTSSWTQHVMSALWFWSSTSGGFKTGSGTSGWSADDGAWYASSSTVNGDSGNPGDGWGQANWNNGDSPDCSNMYEAGVATRHSTLRTFLYVE